MVGGVSRHPANETLPIFPLPSVVLFPRVRVPLHIFEARYRQMTAAALEGERCIGMVTVLPNAISQMQGDPPIFDVGCSGVIEQIEEREDGRYDLVLLGTHRFRVRQEIEGGADQLFRIARVESLDEIFRESDELPLQALRLEVVEILQALMAGAEAGDRGRFDPRRFSGIDDKTFVNLICQHFDGGAAEKQGLLETDDVVLRCRRLVALLRFRLAERGGSESSSSVH